MQRPDEAASERTVVELLALHGLYQRIYRQFVLDMVVAIAGFASFLIGHCAYDEASVARTLTGLLGHTAFVMGCLDARSARAVHLRMVVLGRLVVR